MFSYIYRMYFENKLHRSLNEVYEQRLNSDATQIFPFHIQPKRRTTMLPTYFMHNSGTTQLICRIYQENRVTERLVDQLPGIVQTSLVRDIFAEELYHTNEIEGVKSSKELFVRSAKLLEDRKKLSGRFASLSETYFRLMNGEIETPKEPSDIRKFYDLLVSDEIEKDHKPDGELFRTDATYIYGDRDQPIHTGITPEKSIIDAIQSLLIFMNDESTPLLIRVAVGHYYFGYIHPFYDGNGRTSRFLSSLYLKADFHTLTALSLSRACNVNRKQYLDAFKKTNEVSMQGEMNFFVDQILRLFLDTQVRMNEEIRMNLYLFKEMKKTLQDHPFLSTHPKHHEVAYILCMHYIFSNEDGMLTPDLVRVAKDSPNLPLGEATTRATLNDLVEKGLVEVTKSGRFNVYKIGQSLSEVMI